MKRFKTIARAISPFVGKKKDTKPAKRDIDNSNNSKASMETSDFSWNLKDVDMTKVLKAFYKTYNPDKVKMTAHILENYAGEEILMLQQLCERYNLSEADMQMYVDQGRVIRRDKSANKRAGDQNSETSTVQMTSKHGLDKSVSRGGSVIDASKYTWNIENVDIAWALKLFHKKYKPGKTHNYSVLKYKSDAEIIKLLRDLCEKYSLEEFQMQYYLDRAVINGDNNTVTSRYSASKNSNHEIEDDIFSISTNNRSVQSTNPTSPRANQFETLRKEQSNMSESHQHQSRVKCTPPPPPPSPPKDKTPTTKQAIPQSNSTRHDVSTLSAANNHFKLPTSVQVPVSSMLQQDIDDISRLSMEDVQEPVYHVSRASAVANNPPKQPTIEEEPVTKEAKHKSVKDMIPPQILPNGRRFTLGPVLSEITKRNKPADVMQPNDSDERESSQAKSLLPPSKHEESKPIPKEPKPEPHRRSIVDSSHISSQKPFVAPVTERKFHDRVEQSNPAKSERKEVKTTDNSELKKMQSELSNTRRQLELVKKESQEMIEAMKESAQKAIMMTTTLASQKKNSNANESVSRSNKFDSSSESKLIDLSGVEGKKVNTIKKTLPRGIPGSMRELSRMSELEDRALELEEQNEILRVKLEACEQDREQAVSQLQDLAKDKRDLLSLLDVMSASPIGIRNILHSFLEKVGEDAQNPKLMFGINQDGEQISMAERIAEALQIKREQEKAVSGILVSPLSSPDKDSNVYSGFNSPDISPNHHSSTSKSSIGITDENRDHPFGPSEGERNNLRNMNPILADKTLYNSSRQSSPNPKRENRDKARENFLTRATTSNANIESADRKTPSDAMTDQYSLARKLRQHQLAEAKLTNQLAKANLQIQQQMTDEILYDTIQRHKEATSSRVGSRSNSPLPVVADWIECYDPRTKRKYYHSPSLHKSTWVNPYNSNPNGDSNSNRLPSRYNSPASTRGNISYSSSPNPRKVSDLYLKAKEDNAFSSSLGQPSRSSSPAESVRSTRSVSSGKSTQSRKIETYLNSPWVMAVDPKSRRKYWYNRETKVSTWRKPAELI